MDDFDCRAECKRRSASAVSAARRRSWSEAASSAVRELTKGWRVLSGGAPCRRAESLGASSGASPKMCEVWFLRREAWLSCSTWSWRASTSTLPAMLLASVWKPGEASGAGRGRTPSWDSDIALSRTAAAATAASSEAAMPETICSFSACVHSRRTMVRGVLPSMGVVMSPMNFSWCPKMSEFRLRCAFFVRLAADSARFCCVTDLSKGCGLLERTSGFRGVLPSIGTDLS
mmetsp:Transcript_13330/g.31707  ORF Transcript_13330/g.31707 Transcript_13330/m.31707 type:complete len:231 (-) Transcript_13330:439-1131(-)